MRTEVVEVTRTIAAPSDTIYNIIADYRNRPSRTLPTRYFSGFVVEEGGFGEGTRIRYMLNAYGTSRFYQAVVEEPEPGRRLIEIDLVSGAYKTYTVDDRGLGGADVTLRMRVSSEPGWSGAIERLLIKRLLRKIFSEELTLLARSARRPAIQAPSISSAAFSLPAGSVHAWLDQGTRARLVEAP